MDFWCFTKVGMVGGKQGFLHLLLLVHVKTDLWVFLAEAKRKRGALTTLII
jgi:hypothetical protein